MGGQTNRKEFLKITGLGLGGFLFNPSEIQAQQVSKGLGGAKFLLNQDITFLNNGTIGPSSVRVVKAIQERINFNAQTATYGGLKKETLRTLSAFLGADSSEIALTHNTSESVNIGAWSIPLKSGDEVIVSDQEHVGGIMAWLNIKRLKHIRIKTISIGSTKDETISNLKNAISRKTRVIALPHVPCTTGTVLPIREIATIAKEKELFFMVDGAHPPGMMPLNLHDLGVDLYASCLHKWLCGPKGTGFLYVAKESLQKLEPIFMGAYSADWGYAEDTVNMKEMADSAHRFFYGTQNTSHYAGIIEAVKEQEEIGKVKIQNHGLELAAYFQAFILSEKKKYEMLTSTEGGSFSHVISFKQGEKSQELTNYLRKNKIITRFVAESNLNCNRISFHLYNTKKDVDRLIKAMQEFG